MPTVLPQWAAAWEVEAEPTIGCDVMVNQRHERRSVLRLQGFLVTRLGQQPLNHGGHL